VEAGQVGDPVEGPRQPVDLPDGRALASDLAVLQVVSGVTDDQEVHEREESREWRMVNGRLVNW
jgi:hypothetical protein